MTTIHNLLDAPTMHPRVKGFGRAHSPRAEASSQPPPAGQGDKGPLSYVCLMQKKGTRSH